MTVEIFLKSGQTVKFECVQCTFKFSDATGEYVGYEFKEIKKYKIISLVPSQIAGYRTYE